MGKVGHQFSTSCFSSGDSADPLQFKDVTMAFAILSVTMVMVVLLVAAEVFMGTPGAAAAGKKDSENFIDYGSCPMCHRQWQFD